MRLTTLTVILALGALYIMGIGMLYVRDGGVVAAYLTMPAWFLVGALALMMGSIAPQSTLDATVFSWTGNLVALVVSAALNVAVTFLVIRRLSRK